MASPESNSLDIDFYRSPRDAIMTLTPEADRNDATIPDSQETTAGRETLETVVTRNLRTSNAKTQGGPRLGDHEAVP
jgi:hypothetical protein